MTTDWTRDDSVNLEALQLAARASLAAMQLTVRGNKPDIKFMPAHPANILTRPSGVFYECVVLHTTVGGRSIEDLGAWFGGGNVAKGVRGSTHFGVGMDGRVGQYVDLGQMAIAHGQDANPTAKLAKDNGSLSANYWGIGIEHLDNNRPGQWTPEQVEASCWLTAWLFETYILPHARVTGATVDRDHIIGHYELSPSTRTCPVRSEAQMAAYIARVRELLAPVVEPPPPPPPPVQTFIEEYRAELVGIIRAAEDDGTRAAVRIQTAQAKLALLG